MKARTVGRAKMWLGYGGTKKNARQNDERTINVALVVFVSLIT